MYRLARTEVVGKTSSNLIKQELLVGFRAYKVKDKSTYYLFVQDCSRTSD
jgi:hypothetical protein